VGLPSLRDVADVNPVKQGELLLFHKRIDDFEVTLDHFRLLVPDETNVNREIVKDGRCWWSRKYAPGDTELEGLEKEARKVKKGILIGT